MRYEPRGRLQTIADVQSMPTIYVVAELTSTEKQSDGR
jgi:hypothetical protein